MRIWSLDPALLDRRALVAGWRETLLAQKVLSGGTKGYTHHPQLERFRECADPAQSVADYLHGVADEADRRGYTFDRTRITLPRSPRPARMSVTNGQLQYEFDLLLSKVHARDPQWGEQQLADVSELTAHPLFQVTEGPIASWERVKTLT